MTPTEVLFAQAEAQFSDRPEVTRGKLFGHPCLSVQGKAFLVRCHDDLVFKLGRARATVLLEAHGELKLFDPSGKGRAMRDWVQAPVSFSDEVSAWSEASCAFVLANL